MTRRIADRYELSHQLGAGGSARVFAARDERLDRQVAIKLLDSRLAASADSGGRERFLREGPTSAAFHHRHAVTVFDAGEADGELYIVMELVDGPSLAEHLAANGTLAIGEATRIAGQVLSALAAAHAAGIVHRDVKPANVLIGADGDVKLADFGIAKRFDELDATVTRLGTVIGTPRYLAPEQAAGGTSTAATDVYAMGTLLFEMLTGRTPFGSDPAVVAALIQQSLPAPDVRVLRPEVSPALAATVARALATDPADRYPSATEMSADLANSWEPPSGASPESLISTQVVDLSPQPMIGIRSGDTQVWTGHVAAHVSADPGPLAAPMAPATQPTPMATPQGQAFTARAAQQRPADPGRRSWAGWSVLAVLLLVAAGAVGGSALFGDKSDPSATTATTTTTMAADEIIPGFARTTDLTVFLAQLDSDPTLVGSAGPALADALRSLLAEDSSKDRRNKAKELRKDIAAWVENDHLHPDIAEALDALLRPLATAAP
ncbi:MAG: serine/threonine-protein kinase [Actinomycetota bacterium]|nr:serine/threonine-protein kinase [Actinomycetota bacterium]